MTAPANDVIDLLEMRRSAEKQQALRYRAMASLAEEEQPELAERFHNLHADEQHHLSRLTARILELGGRPKDLRSVGMPQVSLEGWEAQVAALESTELEAYRAIDLKSLDSETQAVIEEIRSVEENHSLHHGGKWTPA